MDFIHLTAKNKFIKAVSSVPKNQQESEPDLCSDFIKYFDKNDFLLCIQIEVYNCYLKDLLNTKYFQKYSDERKSRSFASVGKTRAVSCRRFSPFPGGNAGE